MGSFAVHHHCVSYMRAYRFEADWALLKPMLISSVLGVIGGVLLLHWLSGNTLNGLRMLLGVVIVLCALLLLMQKSAGPVAFWPCCTVVCGYLIGFAKRPVRHARPTHGLSPLPPAA